MYSMVLVMALAGSAEAPDCHSSCGCCGMSYSSYGCYGGNYGGCYGGGYYGGSYGGNYGGCYGGYSGGCYGSGGVYYGSPGMYGGTGGAYKMPAGERVGEPKKDQSKAPAPGTIVVTLPANAKLLIDDYASNQTSAERTLVTPPIQTGQVFTYTLVAEVHQNGLPVRQSQSVTVGPGQQRSIRFTFEATPVAAGH